MLLRCYFHFNFLLSLILLFACNQPKTNNMVEKKKFNKVIHAENFKLIQHPTFIELQIIDPEKGRIERKYALLTKGVLPPVASELEVIEVPVKGLVCLSATHIGMLQKLNSVSLIKGVAAKKYISNSDLLKNILRKKVEEFESIDQLNPERILKSGTKLVLYDGFGTYPSNEEKLKKIGVYCIPNYDWRETNPLGKAEWIKLFGVLTGKEKQATNYFNKISKEYNALKKQANQIKTHQSIISGSLIGDLWYMPAGESFYAHILHDAKFDYQEQHSKGTGSVSFSLEHCLKFHKDAKIWINPGVESFHELIRLNSKYRFFTAFRKKEIYCYSHNANYFWENSAIEPHHLLSDLIALNKGEGSTKKLYFYRKLAE